MMASCGPALRKSLAKMVRMKNKANSARPIITAFCVSIQVEFSLTPETGVHFARQFVPGTNVGDSFFISCDYDLGTLRDRSVALSTGSGDATGTGLRVDHLSGASGTNGQAEASEHADHFVIGRVQFL